MITKKMNLAKIIEEYPEVISVLQNKGVGCIGCMMAHSETLEQGVTAHGLDAEEIVNEMNAVIEKK